MNETKIPYKIYLNENEIPTAWYNLRADMKNKPAPLLNPDTRKPMSAEELSGVFCEELVAQELDDTTAYIPIPQEIQDFYRMYRPSPLVRAYCLEEKLRTPARIYYKLKETTRAAATSSIPPLPRPITQKSRAFWALPRKPAQVSGVRLSPWHVPISAWTALSIW